jgi:hypothetical protein
MFWNFPRQPASMVEQDITQRDQFSNDDVALSETIIRESVQNSLDAAAVDGEPVRVSYRWLTSEDGLDSEFMNEMISEQLPHAEVAGIDISEINFSTPSALIIEDFGTKGLTGNTAEIDDGNFSDFWRRHGKSHKTGTSRGRWGLGKLVYSTTSELGVFFGATCRDGDPGTYIMGQTVLNLRTYNGQRYPPHAFFSDMSSDDPQDGLPVPIKNTDFVERFEKQFCLERNGEPGLSVVIPFPNRSFSLENMIGVSVANYFYPLITGQLTLQFNEVNINAENVRECAEKYSHDAFRDIDPLFDFVEGAYQMPASDLLELRGSWADDKKLDAADFEQEDLERMRSQFVNGELIGLKLPLTLTKKDGQRISTSFKVFIQKPENLHVGLDLYVRGGLTVSGERKFGSRKALGAMIAEDVEICSFLGDAENAAHTKWIGTAEKLAKNYRSPADKVKVIKNAVLNLYDMLAQDAEEEDERGLVKFFSVPAEQGDPKKKRKTPPKPFTPPAPKKQRVKVQKIAGGFRVHAPDEADASLYPCVIKVRCAYEVIRGNAFNKYDPSDFCFGKQSSVSLTIAGSGKILSEADNRFEVVVTAPDFEIRAMDFDENRDLKIDVRAEAIGNAADD